MSKKSKSQKDARSLQEHYGVKYQTALNLIRQLGLEGAMNELDRRKNAGDKPEETSE